MPLLNQARFSAHTFNVIVDANQPRAADRIDQEAGEARAKAHSVGRGIYGLRWVGNRIAEDVASTHRMCYCEW